MKIKLGNDFCHIDMGMQKVDLKHTSNSYIHEKF